MAEEFRDDMPDSIRNRPDNPIKISGPMPPAMEKAIKEVKPKGLATEQSAIAPQGQMNMKKSVAQKPLTNMPPKETGGGAKFFKNEWQSYVRPQGSTQLEDLIEKCRSTPYEKIELPSKGKFYNGQDGPTDGVLHLRAMTGAEEQILATPKFIKTGQAINMIFQRCIKEGYRVENLLSVDRTYILIWLRGISYSPEYEVEIRCPDTNNKFTHKINLSEDVLVNYCPDDFSPESLSGVLPKSEFNFTYKLSRGRDEAELQSWSEKWKKKFGNENPDETLIYRTVSLVGEIEGLTDKAELATLVKQLPIQDVAYLRNLVTDPPFGVDTKISVYSPHSMNEFEIDLPLDSGFFFPRQKRRKEEEHTPNSQPT